MIWGLAKRKKRIDKLNKAVILLMLFAINFMNSGVNSFKSITQIIIFVSAFLVLGSCQTKNPLKICVPEECPDALKSMRIDFDACWSPIGDSLTFAHTAEYPKTESVGIYIMDSAGISKRFFRWDPLVYSPRWSPVGNWILFNTSGQIYKIKTNGDSLTQLTFSNSNFYPNWSPDGKRIIYHINSPPDSAGVWVVDADGNNKRRVLGGGCPSFSPDGSKIVYVSLYYQLYIADTTGNNKVQITSLTGGGGTCYPSFSPQSDKIVFQFQLDGYRPDVWVINSDGTNLKRLTTEGGESPCWSPDGSKIVYTNTRPDNGFLWIMNPDGSKKRQISS